MVKIHFNTTKGRMSSHMAMMMVAQDVGLWVQKLNEIYKTDRDLPCPEPLAGRDKGRESYGIVNETELWFGLPAKGKHLDVSIHKKNTSHSVTIKDDIWLQTLMQLTALSLCEQFYNVRFETNEDFSWAISIYEDNLGAISNNAASSCGVAKRV